MKYDTLHETHEYKEKIDEVAPPSEGATTTARSPALSDEAKLVQRLSQGDKNALITLYENYVDRVYRHLYKKVGNTTEAQDLTSETFTRAIEAIMRKKYTRQDKPFGAWLFGIANHILQERWRKLNDLPFIENLDILLESFEPMSYEFLIQIFIIQSPAMQSQILQQKKQLARELSAPALAIRQIHEALLQERGITSFSHQAQNNELIKSWRQWLSNYDGTILSWDPSDDEAGFLHTRETLKSKNILPNPLTPQLLYRRAIRLIEAIFEIIPNWDFYRILVPP